MAVNYYDQFQPLTYNPMSLQEMLIGPQMMQQKHDEAQALLDQESLFDVPALSVDQPGVQEWMDKYKSNINELADNLLRSGYNKDLARKARRILQEKQQATSSRGYLGKASKAYQDYLKNVEDEKKRLEKGEINRDQYQRGLALALQRYNQAGGASKDATWSPWTSTKAIDLQDLVSKYGKEITPQTIAEDLGGTYDEERGIITDRSRKTVTITPERIMTTIINRIRSNPEAMAYLKEREALGLSNGVEQELFNLGLQGASTFARNDIENKVNRDYSLFKKFQQGVFESEQMNRDAIARVLSLDIVPIENLAEISKRGTEKDMVWTQGTSGPGTPGLQIPLFLGKLIGFDKSSLTKEDQDEIQKFANQQIDNQYDIYKSAGANISREDILNWEDNWGKSAKTTLAFNMVPNAMYEEKYSQDVDKLKSGSFPGSIQDWAIEGKTLKDQDDWIDAIGYDPKKNKVSEVSTAWSGNGYMLAEITMQNGETIRAVRKPTESDQAKFATANILFNKFYSNERGKIQFTNPKTGYPIEMTKVITPDGLKASVVFKKPSYNNQGQLVGWATDIDFMDGQSSMDYNRAIQKLTPFVLKDKYVNRYSKQRESY